LWSAYCDLALSHSLRACWSTPVSPQGKVIATFAMYYREPRRPTQRDQKIVDQITYLAGVAIQHKLAQEKLQRSEAYLTEAEKLTHTGSWAWDVRTQKVLHCSDEMFRIFGLDPLESLPSRKNFRQRVHPEDRDWVDMLQEIPERITAIAPCVGLVARRRSRRDYHRTEHTLMRRADGCRQSRLERSIRTTTTRLM
jgi:PAS domain-containing protein